MNTSTHMFKDFSESLKKGIRLRRLNTALAVISVVISVLLLLATYRTSAGYLRMRSSTDSYIRLQQNADRLQDASDYLTEQVRCFVVTADDTYLKNYFEEAEITRTRDAAVDTLRSEMEGSQAYYYLSSAMQNSVDLMNIEYYAMRLVLESEGRNIASYPEALKSVSLTEGTLALSPQEQKDMAVDLVFNRDYRTYKTAITQNIDLSISSLINETERSQTASAEELSKLLLHEQILILLLVVMVFVLLLLTTRLVIRPLIKAVNYITEEQPVPVTGSREFRFLANTYNKIYVSNKEKTVQLEYDASHDALTGCFNRSGYQYIVENTDLSSAALILIDVDNFKQVNDTHGHETGDKVLKNVADLLKGNFRAEDQVCRLGGDEFAIIMGNVNLLHKELISSKIRLINRTLEVPAEGVPPVSISAGASFGNDSKDERTLYREADEALYMIKANGKRDCCFSEE